MSTPKRQTCIARSRTYDPSECLRVMATAWVDIEAEFFWLEHDATFMAEHGDQLRELRQAGAAFAERLEALTAAHIPGFGFTRQAFSGTTDAEGNATVTLKPGGEGDPTQTP